MVMVVRVMPTLTRVDLGRADWQGRPRVILAPMRGAAAGDPSALDCAIDIAVAPEVVYEAFFWPDRLRSWLHVRGSVTTPKSLGVYALEWPTAADPDPLLGPFGGAFYGVVIDVRPGREFFLADAYWIPPDGDPVGPMALHVTCDPAAPGTRLRLQQSGCDDSPRWRRLYRVMGTLWHDALARLKHELERPLTPPAESSGSSHQAW
jgi:hypothetical protein